MKIPFQQSKPLIADSNQLNTFIYVKFQKEGIHCYPAAKDLPGVEFLQHPHRHMFHFKVMLEVMHDDRDVEFILLKRALEGLYADDVLELDYKSCEMIANDLYKYVEEHWPGRRILIDVSEDNENGAVVMS